MPSGTPSYVWFGSLATVAPRAVIERCQSLRMSARAELRSSGQRIRIELVGGQVREVDGADPKQVALWRDGSFRVTQELPGFVGGLSGQREAKGLLADRTVPDLLVWAEKVRLTGTLDLYHGAERAHIELSAGSVSGVVLDGRADLTALSLIESWNEGEWQISLRPLFVEETAPVFISDDGLTPTPTPAPVFNDDGGDDPPWLAIPRVERALTDREREEPDTEVGAPPAAAMETAAEAAPPPETAPPEPPPAEAAPPPAEAAPPPPAETRETRSTGPDVLGGSVPVTLGASGPVDASVEPAAGGSGPFQLGASGPVYEPSGAYPPPPPLNDPALRRLKWVAGITAVVVGLTAVTTVTVRLFRVPKTPLAQPAPPARPDAGAPLVQEPPRPKRKPEHDRPRPSRAEMRDRAARLIDRARRATIEGKKKVAINLLEEAQKLDPDNPSIRIYLAQARGKLGEGILLIESTPSRAKVLVDGAQVGETPLRLKAVPAGEHTVQVGDKSEDVEITRGKKTSLKFKLHGRVARRER